MEEQLRNIILFVPVMLILLLTEWNVMATTRGIVFRTIQMSGAFGHAVVRLVFLKVEKFLFYFCDYCLLRENLGHMWLKMNTWTAVN
jgi:hypothetical protein